MIWLSMITYRKFYCNLEKESISIKKVIFKFSKSKFHQNSIYLDDVVVDSDDSILCIPSYDILVDCESLDYDIHEVLVYMFSEFLAYMNPEDLGIYYHWPWENMGETHDEWAIVDNQVNKPKYTIYYHNT